MRIFLLDFSSLAHPAWHINGNDPDPNSTSDHVVARVRSLATGYDRVAVCVESGKSFRCDISPAYKAHREAKPAAFYHQYQRAVEILERDGFVVLGAPKFEADDVLCTAAAWARAQEPPHDVVIGTSDKDLLSLIQPGVSVYSLTKGVELGRGDVIAKFGVPPERMLDFLALTGDASDAIEGIRGVGAKHAARLLTEFGSISGIYSALSQTPDAVATPSIRKALIDGVGVLDLALKLVALRCDAPVDCAKLLDERVVKSLPTVNYDEYDNQEEETMSELVDTATGEVIETQERQAQAESQPIAPTNGAVGAPAATVTTPAQSSLAVLSESTHPSAPAQWSKELEPRTFDQAAKLAKFMYDSRMFSAYGTPQAVLSTILAGRELGVGAMASLRGFHVIEGKVALAAGMMQALVLQSGKAKYFRCVKSTNEEATFKTLRVGEDQEPVTVTWTMKDAERAGLIKPKSGWEKYPADMLVARCVARLARLVFGDVLFGMYTTEELGREDLEVASDAA